VAKNKKKDVSKAAKKEKKAEIKAGKADNEKPIPTGKHAQAAAAGLGALAPVNGAKSGIKPKPQQDARAGTQKPAQPSPGTCCKLTGCLSIGMYVSCLSLYITAEV